MKIFILRHGESKFNKKGVHQLFNTSLSKKGKTQALKSVNHLRKISINKIYSSPLLRAKQTSEIISNQLSIPFSILEELQEIKRPSEIRGKKHNDPKALIIKKQIKNHFHDVNWHYSDEENFLDIKRRAILLMKKIKKEYKSNENILLITHGGISRMVIALILFGNKLRPEDFLNIYEHSTLDNTGLSAIDYVPPNNWKLLFWNNNSHLRHINLPIYSEKSVSEIS